MAKQIIIDVDDQGNVTIETKGYNGTGCKDATKELERLLGVKTSDKPTAEAYTKPVNTTKAGA